MIRAGEGDSGRNPDLVISGAIHNLVAARLGRAFVPLAGLFAAGMVRLLGGAPGGLWMAVGAVASAGAMLWYGLAIVRAPSGRGSVAGRLAGAVCTVVPSLFGIYVLGWAGLRGLAAATGGGSVAAAILYVALGVWVLTSWLRLTEVRRLAQVMIPSHDLSGESTR